MIASVEKIEKCIEAYKVYIAARDELLYGKASNGDVYMFLNPDQFYKISKTLGKKPSRVRTKRIDSQHFDHNGCVFYLSKTGGDAA